MGWREDQTAWSHALTAIVAQGLFGGASGHASLLAWILLLASALLLVSPTAVAEPPLTVAEAKARIEQLKRMRPRSTSRTSMRRWQPQTSTTPFLGPPIAAGLCQLKRDPPR